MKIFPLLWTYTIKDCGTKKAPCIYNGAPSKKGSVTLGATYAGSLGQTGLLTFFATAAMKNLKVYSTNVSNAFAEAPPPKAPPFVTIDKQFRERWAGKGRKLLTDGLVLPIQHTLQDHPESLRLYAKLVTSILVEKMDFKPTTYEPFLYSGA